jgi:hypothetical protein
VVAALTVVGLTIHDRVDDDDGVYDVEVKKREKWRVFVTMMMLYQKRW